MNNIKVIDVILISSIFFNVLNTGLLTNHRPKPDD
jgi:hypothetical protein